MIMVVMMRITKVISGDDGGLVVVIGDDYGGDDENDQGDGGLVVVEPHQGKARVAKVCAQPECMRPNTAATLNTVASNNTEYY